MMTVERNQDGEFTRSIQPHEKARRVACVLPQTRKGQAQGFRRGSSIAGHRLRGVPVAVQLPLGQRGSWHVHTKLC